MKKNNLGLFFLTLITMISLTSCSIFKPFRSFDERDMFEQNLMKWRNFEISGLVEVNYLNYRFRKIINIRKCENAFRLDVFDSGIFGLMNKPFISIYAADIIQVRDPLGEKTEINFQAIKDFNIIKLFDRNLDLVKKEAETVVTDRYYIKENFEIYFNQWMDIEKIKFSGIGCEIDPLDLQLDKIEISIVYKNQIPDEISFIIDRQEVLKIFVDNIEFKNVQIERIN